MLKKNVMHEKNKCTEEDRRTAVVKNKRIEELGVYYLYFLCSFMDKIAEKIKGVKIESRKNIEFRNFLTEDFQNRCENIRVYSLEMVDELESYKDVDINFCERFIYIVNDMYERANCQDEGVNKNIDFKKFREDVFKDLKYLCFNCFGVVLSERNIYIEDAMEFFDSMAYDIAQNKVHESIFVLEDSKVSMTEINSSYMECGNEKQNSNKDQELYESYINVKDKLNDKLVDFNNKIGYRLANMVVLPYIQELYVSSNTWFEEVNSYADEFLSFYFYKIQNEYLLHHINDILSLKDMDAVKKYMNSSGKDNFLLIGDMEDLVKNG